MELLRRALFETCGGRSSISRRQSQSYGVVLVE